MLGRKKSEPVGRRPNLSNRNTAPVFSYRANRSTNDTNVGRGQEQQAKPRTKAVSGWHHLPTWLALGVIVACLGYVTLLTPNAKVVITNEPSAKEELRSLQTYQEAAKKVLGGLSNRNKLTINPDKVADTLEKQFPELKKVTVAIPLVGKRPVVTLQPVKPALTISGNGGNYVIDIDGQAIARTSDLPQISKQLQQVTDQSGLELKAGEKVLSEEDVAFITTFIQQLHAQKVNISAVILPPVPNELDIRIDGQPYVIKTNIAGNARLQAGMYLAAKAKFESDKAIPSESVDTRVEERVYYK